MSEGLLTVAQAAEFLATTERHMERLVNERRISFVKVGRRVCFTMDDLHAYIQKHRTVVE